MVATVTVIPSSRVGGDALENGSWICNCFAMPGGSIDQVDLDRRIHSWSDYSVGDHTLGGGPALNMPPGWTRTCDIPAGFGMQGTPETGFGTFQGEMQIQHLDLLHLRAGIPEYNSLANFYDRLYDPGAAALANEGSAGILRPVLDLAVSLAGWYIAMPIMPFILAGRFISWISDKPYSAYCYLRPTMSLFWMSFNTAANALAINMGLGLQSEMKKWDSTNGQPIEASGLDKEAMEAINKYLPDIYRKNGTIDIFAASTRHKRLQNAYARYLADQAGGSSSFEDFLEKVASTGRKVLTYPTGGFNSIVEMMSAYSNTEIAQGEKEQDSTLDPTQADTIPDVESAGTGAKASNDTDINLLEYYEQDFSAHVKAMAVSGGDFVTFAVDYVKDVSVSITNQTGESAVSSKINSIVSAARSGKFTMMHGNISDGLIGSALEGVIGIAKSIGESAKSAAGLNILNAIQGNGFVDIPDVWQSASTEMPTMEYSFRVEAPSAHPLAKFQMMLPIVAMICLTAPRSTGSKSYTQPFFIEASHKGRNYCPMGVISSLNIQFGDDRDDDDMPLSGRVTFSITNLSNKLHVPISAEVSNFFDEDNTFGDLLKVMGAVTLHDRDSISASIKRRMAGWMVGFSNITSPAWAANSTVGKLAGGALGLFLPVTNRN